MSVGSYGGYQPAIAGADYPAGPSAWLAGQSWPLRLPPRVFAADLNQQLSSAVAFLSTKPQAKVVQQVHPTSFSNNILAWIDMDTEIDDAWGMHANSGDSSQVVVPQGCDGLWLVQGVVPFHAPSTLGFMYEAKVNHQVGATANITNGERMEGWGNGAYPMPWAFDIFNASAGDYFQLGGQQTSGSTVSAGINTAASGGIQFNHAYYPLLTARWIAANNSLPGGVIGVPFLQGDGTWSAVENVQLTVPSPGTWTSLQEATSARFNSDILNSVLFLSNVPVARANFSSPAVVPRNAYSQVTGLTVQMDNWSAFNTSTSTWTAPVNGVYLIMGQVSYPSQGVLFTDSVRISATISGVSTTWDGAASYGDNVAASAVRQMRLSAGDTIQLYTWQNSSSNLAPDGPNCRLITVWMSA
jgi:hypothetical protein